MKYVFLASSRLSGRLHLWWPTVFFLSRTGSLRNLDPESRLRLSYAFLLGRANPKVQQTFARMIRREVNRSGEIDLWLSHVAWSLGRPGLAICLYRRAAKVHKDSSEGLQAAKEALFAEALQSRTLETSLYSTVSKVCVGLHDGQPLILVALSSRYLELFSLWKQQTTKHVQGQLVVLAMDNGVTEHLKTDKRTIVIDLSTYFTFDITGRVDDYNRHHLWMLRVLIIKSLISLGRIVISLDLDAILLSDLSKMLESLPQADIIAQQDYSGPMDVARKFGFIVCCGFMVIRSNQSTVSFLERYVRQTNLELDDQSALNHLLADCAITNVIKEPSYLAFHSAGVSWVCPTPELVSRDLDYGTVVRHFQQQEQRVDELKARLGLSA